MTSFDKLISSDLALLAGDSRQRLRSVDEVLAAVGATTHDGAERTALYELALLRLANGYAQRLAHAAAGVAALGCAAWLAVLLWNPLGASRNELPGSSFGAVLSSWYGWFLSGDVLSVAARIGVLIAVTHIVVSRLAAVRFEQRLLRVREEQRIELGRRMLRSIDPWAVFATIAGTTSLATLFGVVVATVGDSSWGWFWFDDYPVGGYFADRARDLGIALPVIALVAFAVARHVRQPQPPRWLRALACKQTLMLGMLLGLVTLLAGFKLDSGVGLPLVFEQVGVRPTSGLRSVLTVTGCAAVFMIATWLALRLGRREDEAISPGRRVG